MNVLNSSPIFPVGNFPTWTMTSRYKRLAFVLKRQSLCKKGISSACLPSVSSLSAILTHQVCSWRHDIAELKSASHLLTSFFPFMLFLASDPPENSRINLFGIDAGEEHACPSGSLLFQNRKDGLTVCHCPACMGH